MTWDSTKTYQLIGTVLFILFLWFFTEIVVYLVISAIIGVVGQPFVKLLSKIKIRKKPFPKALSATISLIIIILVLSSIMAILVPSIASQAEDLAKIDKQQVATQWGNIFTSTELRLREINILKPDQDLETIIVYNFSGLLNKLEFSKVLGSLVDMTGNLFMGVFSVLFMSFFFIKEEDLFQRIVMLFVSEKYERSTSHILLKIKKMLSRYFFGILIEVSTMMLLITIGGLIIGLENAILIGFIGGLMNIIPYLGPLIGASIGSILVFMTTMYLGLDHTLAMIGAILAVFAVANLIDNFLLQPLIYSNSVSAHPLEIFIVIVMGGTLGGPIWMIVAIPIYTVLRVIAKEGLSDKTFVKRLMKDL